MISSYASALALPLSHILTRLDGLYGNAAPLADLLAAGGPGVIVRGKDYHLLDLPAVSARLQQPPDQQTRHPESGTSRALYDCLDIALTPTGPRVRMLLAARLASASPPAIGTLRNGTVYEQFFTTVPPNAFTPADVLDLYLHRGSFETVLADLRSGTRPGSLGVSYALWARVLANPLAMDLESSPGVRAAGVCFSHAFDRTGLFSD